MSFRFSRWVSVRQLDAAHGDAFLRSEVRAVLDGYMREHGSAAEVLELRPLAALPAEPPAETTVPGMPVSCGQQHTRSEVEFVVPFGVFVRHEARCRANHEQSLETIRARGGFSVGEAAAVLQDRPWKWASTVSDREALQVVVHAWATWTAGRFVRAADRFILHGDTPPLPETPGMRIKATPVPRGITAPSETYDVKAAAAVLNGGWPQQCLEGVGGAALHVFVTGKATCECGKIAR